MLAHRLLALGEVDAEGLVLGDEGFEPLHPRRQLRERFVRGRGGALELLAAEAFDAGYITFDHIFLHDGSPASSMSPGGPGGCPRLGILRVAPDERGDLRLGAERGEAPATLVQRALLEVDGRRLAANLRYGGADALAKPPEIVGLGEVEPAS